MHSAVRTHREKRGAPIYLNALCKCKANATNDTHKNGVRCRCSHVYLLYVSSAVLFSHFASVAPHFLTISYCYEKLILGSIYSEVNGREYSGNGKYSKMVEGVKVEWGKRMFYVILLYGNGSYKRMRHF